MVWLGLIDIPSNISDNGYDSNYVLPNQAGIIKIKKIRLRCDAFIYFLRKSGYILVSNFSKLSWYWVSNDGLMVSSLRATLSVWVIKDWLCNIISIWFGKFLNFIKADIIAIIDDNAMGTSKTMLLFHPICSFIDSNIPVVRDTIITHLFQLSFSRFNSSWAKLKASHFAFKSWMIWVNSLFFHIK